MSFFTNLRADRLVTEIRSATDPTSSDTQKLVARLKDVGPGAIESIFGALPDADKAATMAFVEVCGSKAHTQTFRLFLRGLDEGRTGVISGVPWARTARHGSLAHMLIGA